MNRATTVVSVAFAFLFGALSSRVLTALGQGEDPLVIHACVRDNNGAVRIVAADEPCQNNEAPLTWGIQGEPGPAGEGSLGELTGRWEGTLSMPPGVCGDPGEYDLVFVLVEDADGNLTGSGKSTYGTGGPFSVSSSVLGQVVGADFEFDNGSSGFVFEGNVQDANTVSGLATQGESCQTGTWSAQKVPPVP